jgi:hypothetical protein
MGSAVRYQHVMVDRDAAIARELNQLIEGVDRRYGTGWHACGCRRPGDRGYGTMRSIIPSRSRPIGMPAAPSAAAAAAEGPVVPGAGSV